MQSLPQFVDDDIVSPSAKKPAIFANEVKNVYKKLNIFAPAPVTVDMMSTVHDSKHVNDIMNLRKMNGHENKNPYVRDTFQWIVGSFVDAVRFSFEKKENCISPTSGFHHAGWATAEGYCTFNGLMIAAHDIVTKKNARVAIIDCDDHWGNGTDDILQRNLLLSNSIKHWTYGAEIRNRKSAIDWLKGGWKKIVRRMLSDVDICFYQAGADSHVNDPLGSKTLYSDEMFERDKILFKIAKEMEVPVVWNLAGGYQKPIQNVIDLHMQTIVAMIEANE